MKRLLHRWSSPDRSLHHTTRRVCLRCDLVRLTRKKPPPADASKLYDMTTSNSWANSAATWLSTKQAADDCKDAEKVLKALGAVAFPATLKGEARANAELKCITKAKRRATLSICGLGWLDETEVEDIPASAKRPARPAPNVMLPPHNPETGEIVDAADAPSTDEASPRKPAAVEATATNAVTPAAVDRIAAAAGEISSDIIDQIDRDLAAAAEQGVEALKAEVKTIHPRYEPSIRSALERRYKPRAAKVDAAKVEA